MLKQRLKLRYDPSKTGGLSAERVYNVKHDDAVAFARTKSIDLKPGAVLFYLPNVTVTRFKIKAFSDKFGVTTTMRADKADYIFINDGEKTKSMKSNSTQQVQYTRYLVLNKNYKEFRLFEEILSPSSILYDAELMTALEEAKGLEIIISEEDASELAEFIRQKTSRYVWYHYGYDKKNFISLPNPFTELETLFGIFLKYSEPFPCNTCFPRLKASPAIPEILRPVNSPIGFAISFTF
jgi:hypothetical protein